MSISNLTKDEFAPNNNLKCKSIATENLYNGELRWVFYAPAQNIPAGTGNGYNFVGYVEQPGSSGDASQFNTTNGTWTCQKDGVYEIDFTQSWDLGASVGGYIRTFMITTGGTTGTRILCDIFENPTVGGLAGSAGSVRHRFRVGQTVKVAIANATANPETINCDIEIMFLRN